MKKFLYIAAAAIAALSACTKAEIEAPETAKAPVFTATIEGDAETKTQLVEGTTAGKLTKVAWLNTDQVCVTNCVVQKQQISYNPYTGAQYAWIGQSQSSVSVYDVAANPSKPSEATLTFSQLLFDGHGSINGDMKWDIRAYYPASLYDNIKSHAVFPSTQTYCGNTISFAPMYYIGIHDALSGNFEMKNSAAILAITIPNTQISSVESIVVSSDQWMNGVCDFDNSVLVKTTDTYTYGEQDEDSNKSITLICNAPGSNTTIPAEGKTFYVSIPAQTYGFLKIDVTDGTTTKTMKTTAASITVARNKIYPINFAANSTKATINGNQVDVPWVQLWAGGPKWAVYNVGATSPAQVGGYYTYGASEAYTASNKDSYSSENSIQGTSYDTAKNLWGSNWQMPTYQDCTNLISTIYTDGGVWKTAENSGYGVAGLLVTGKGVYQSNKVFFPASGFYSGDDLFTPNASTCWAPGGSGGMCLFAEDGAKFINTLTKDKGLPVRAIVRE